MVYSFQKMFFIGQNLNHVHMTHSFVQLLIFFCLEFISHHTKEILYVNTNFMGNKSWNTNHQLVSNIDVEKTCFFNVNVSIWVFFLSRKFTIHRTSGEGGGYLFNSSLPLPLLHRNLDISRAVTAESSPLHISSRTRTRNLRFSRVNR